MLRLNKIKEKIAIKIEGIKVVVVKKTIYFKLVSDPILPFFLSRNILNVSFIINPKNNNNKIRSIKSIICRFKSFNSIKLRLIKVKNVNRPNIIQISDVDITHL